MERRLGRGLGTLLGESTVIDDQKESSSIPVSKIGPNPFQPRTTFDESELADLSRSLRQHGLLQPVLVRSRGEGFDLISGERRWRAAKLAGLTEIPAVVRDGVTDAEMLELALVENLQRQDLDAIERARGFRAMMSNLGITQEEVAEKVGLQRATVANHLRLLELPEDVQSAVSRGLIGMGHARALLAIGSPRRQSALLSRIVREGLSVRAVEAEARSDKGSSGKPGTGSRSPVLASQPPWVGQLVRRLQDRLGTRVSVENGKGYRGRIVLQYYDRRDLDRLCDILAPADRVE